jgi:hypothetical protein
MAHNLVKVMIKLAGRDEPIDATLDMTNRHDVENWLMGRRFLSVKVQNPRICGTDRVYGTECKLGPDLGKTAQVMFLP